MAALRRLIGFAEFLSWLGFLLPQRYDLTSSQGERIAQYRQRCNPFVYTLDVACDEPTSSPLDAWLLVA